MGFYTTDTLEAAPPRRTSSTRACDGVASERRRARRDPVRSRKPLRGPTRGAISGYRYYSPRMGRWITRDPIGMRGGKNLFLALANSPISYWDGNGLFPWNGCCGGEKYNRISHCCRRGVVYRKKDRFPLPGKVCCHYKDFAAFLLSKAVGSGMDRLNPDFIAIGIKFSKNGILGMRQIVDKTFFGDSLLFGFPEHCWITNSGGNVPTGFYPNSTWPWFHAGQYLDENERDHLYPEKGFVVCQDPEMVSPCKFDFQTFNACIKGAKGIFREEPYYNFGIYDCRHWANDAILKCKELSQW